MPLMPIECPKCGAVSPDNRLACANCGRKLRRSGGGFGMLVVALLDFVVRWMGRIAIMAVICGGIMWWLWKSHIPVADREEAADKAGKMMDKLRSSLGGDEGASGSVDVPKQDEEVRKAMDRVRAGLAEPDEKMIETLKMKLDPSRLREGHQAEVYLLNGTSDRGKVFKVTQHHISIVVGSQIRGYFPDDIRVIAQGYPVELSDGERSECIAALSASWQVNPVKPNKPRTLSVTVANKSKYAFLGTVVLSSPGAADPIKVDVSRGLGVPAGATRVVAARLGDHAETAQFDARFEGAFCDKVEVKPEEKLVLEKVPVVDKTN